MSQVALTMLSGYKPDFFANSMHGGWVVIVGDAGATVRVPLMCLAVASPVFVQAAEGVCHGCCGDCVVHVPGCSGAALRGFANLVTTGQVYGYDAMELETLTDLCDAFGLRGISDKPWSPSSPQEQSPLDMNLMGHMPLETPIPLNLHNLSHHHQNPINDREALSVNGYVPPSSSPRKFYSRNSECKRPYKCNVCEKSFVNKSYLPIHERIHTQEKPYECSVCQKKFSQQCYLEAHSRVHSKEKPYTCVVCNRTFTQKSSLNTHMKMHHQPPEGQVDQGRQGVNYGRPYVTKPSTSTAAQQTKIHSSSQSQQEDQNEVSQSDQARNNPWAKTNRPPGTPGFSMAPAFSVAAAFPGATAFPGTPFSWNYSLNTP